MLPLLYVVPMTTVASIYSWTHTIKMFLSDHTRPKDEDRDKWMCVLKADYAADLTREPKFIHDGDSRVVSNNLGLTRIVGQLSDPKQAAYMNELLGFNQTQVRLHGDGFDRWSKSRDMEMAAKQARQPITRQTGQQRIKELQQKIDDLEKESLRLANGTDSTSAENVQLVREINALRAAKSTDASTINRLMTQKTEREEMLRTAEARVADRAAKLAAKTEENARLAAEVVAEKEEKTRLAAEVAARNAEIEALEATLSALRLNTAAGTLQAADGGVGPGAIMPPGDIIPNASPKNLNRLAIRERPIRKVIKMVGKGAAILASKFVLGLKRIAKVKKQEPNPIPPPSKVSRKAQEVEEEADGEPQSHKRPRPT